MLERLGTRTILGLLIKCSGIALKDAPYLTTLDIRILKDVLFLSSILE
jgi:hypothetical protein